MSFLSFCLLDSLHLTFISEVQCVSVDSFFLSALNISSHSLLACKISTEKSTDRLMGYLVCENFFFFLATFKIFSLPLILDNFIIMCLEISLD